MKRCIKMILSIMIISIVIVGCNKKEEVQPVRHEINGTIISSVQVNKDEWYSIVKLNNMDILNFNDLYAMKTSYEMKYTDREQFISMGFVGQKNLGDTYILRIPTIEEVKK